MLSPAEREALREFVLGKVNQIKMYQEMERVTVKHCPATAADGFEKWGGLPPVGKNGKRRRGDPMGRFK